MMPPSCGTFSCPRQSRLVKTRSRGLATTMTSRYQKPSRWRRRTCPVRARSTTHLHPRRADATRGLARMPDMGTGAGRWAIVIPVKRLAEAKTRLRLDPDVRMDLALAMAADTVRAAVACALTAVVVAVSDDERALATLPALGAVVVPDEPDAGLNPALVHGAATPPVPAGTGVVALAADLPALRAEDLEDLLTRVPADAQQTGVAVVADAGGTGTTLLAAHSRDTFRPAFGSGSRATHLDAGAVDLTALAAATLRRDVDTLADLATAATLGLGPATLSVVRAHNLLATALS